MPAASMKRLQAVNSAELDARLPAILDCVFKGEVIVPRPADRKPPFTLAR